MMLCRLITVLFAASILCGCAGVTFYSDAALKTQTGIPIYAPKPYLLVARTGAKDKPVDISVVYLNDPQKVIYADPRSGFGSSNLTLALTNGQMTSFGQQTDTKIPELITSLSGLLTSRATASKTDAEAAQIRSTIGKTQQAASTTTEAGNKIAAIASDMAARFPKLKGLTDEELQTVKSSAQALQIAGHDLSDASNVIKAPKLFADVKAQIDALGKIPSTATAGTPRAASLDLIQAWITQLSKHVDSAQPEKEEPPAFELYEIVQGESGGPSLRRVLAP